VTAAEYGGITGVPALFSREIFDELFKLEGELGARSIIRGHKDPLTIRLEEAATDVDDRSEIERLDDHK
jgi:molybdenum cofactor cytidylyltransferase